MGLISHRPSRCWGIDKQAPLPERWGHGSPHVAALSRFGPPSSGTVASLVGLHLSRLGWVAFESAGVQGLGLETFFFFRSGTALLRRWLAEQWLPWHPAAGTCTMATTYTS